MNHGCSASRSVVAAEWLWPAEAQEGEEVAASRRHGSMAMGAAFLLEMVGRLGFAFAPSPEGIAALSAGLRLRVAGA